MKKVAIKGPINAFKISLSNFFIIKPTTQSQFFETNVYLELMMVEETKIALSNKELEVVCNTDFIFTKHIIIKKVIELFGSLAAMLEDELKKDQAFLPEEIFKHRPKISKGENYLLLPYVMLDYPRCFAKDDTLAVRTFFWWGNFFSVTLQVAGTYKLNIINNIAGSFQYLQQNGYSICINQSQWEHHFAPDNYLPISELTQEEFLAVLNGESFLKLAKKIPLQSWQTAPGFITKCFGEMMQWVKTA
jgi:hypothetical protein